MAVWRLFLLLGPLCEPSPGRSEQAKRQQLKPPDTGQLYADVSLADLAGRFTGRLRRRPVPLIGGLELSLRQHAQSPAKSSCAAVDGSAGHLLRSQPPQSLLADKSLLLQSADLCCNHDDVLCLLPF